MLALLGLLWAGAWIVVPFSAGATETAAFGILGVVMVVFAVGECLHGAVSAPLAADLAEPRLLGRYMALNALSWNIGFTLGPGLGGLGLSVSPTGVWIAAAALCALGSGAALAIERTLPLRARRTPVLAPSSA